MGVRKGRSLASKKERTKFIKLMREYMEEVGADEVDGHRLYAYTMMTRVGGLELSLDEHNSEGLATVFCRFDDEKRACAVLNPELRLGGAVNPFSGKWNHHYFGNWTADDAFYSFKIQLDALRLPVPA